MGFWDQLTGKAGANAARGAAADQYGKQLQAADASRAAGNTYQSGLNQVSQNYNPFVSGGNAALERLMAGLGLGGDQAAFTAAYRGLPGYQSGLDRGANAVTAKLNAGAGVQSGAAMKALQKYGSDYEDSRVGDYLTRLYQMGNQGLTATDAQSKMRQQGYTGQLQGNLLGSQMQYGGAGTIGQGMVAGANAEAAGAQNLLNTGVNLAGRLMGMPSFGSSFGGGSQSPSVFMGGEGQNPWMRNASWGAA